VNIFYNNKNKNKKPDTTSEVPCATERKVEREGRRGVYHSDHDHFWAMSHEKTCFN